MKLTEDNTSPMPGTDAAPAAETETGAAQSTDTPETVQDAATESDALPLGSTSLLGTMLGQSDPRALVRLRGGHVRTLRPGDRINRATVQAIEPGALILVENGTARRLDMPGG